MDFWGHSRNTEVAPQQVAAKMTRATEAASAGQMLLTASSIITVQGG